MKILNNDLNLGVEFEKIKGDYEGFSQKLEPRALARRVTSPSHSTITKNFRSAPFTIFDISLSNYEVFKPLKERNFLHY